MLSPGVVFAVVRCEHPPHCHAAQNDPKLDEAPDIAVKPIHRESPDIMMKSFMDVTMAWLSTLRATLAAGMIPLIGA